MSPPLGRVEAALARREGRAPGMARYRGTARWISRRTWIWAATGDTDIATPYEIVRLSGSWALAGGADGERGRGLRGRAREALNEGGQELREKRVGLLEGVERAQAQFADEAVLQGAPEAFDAAFGLRRLRGDEPDAEGLEHAPEMGGVLVAAQLFGERPVPIIALEEAEAIAVERHGDPVLSARLPQHGGVAVEILGGPKPEGERDGGGIVDEPMQGGRRPAVLEPGEGA